MLQRLLATIPIVVFLALGVEAKTIHHYVFYGMDREWLQADKLFVSTKRFEGAQVAYFWKQLEPGRDEYDFSLIREDLAYLRSHDKRLWIQIQDVTFGERIAVPKYLQNDPKFNGGIARQYRIGDDEAKAVPQGWTARRWDPAVQERLHRLYEALAKEFDGQIEGINLAETSVTFGWTGKIGYPISANACASRLQQMKCA